MGIDKMGTFGLSKNDTLTFKYDQKTQLIDLYNSDSTLINESFTIKNHFFSSSSGNQLNGWLLKERNTKPTTTILLLHGSGVNNLLHYQNAQPLLNENYQVFLVDYSGYGFSEGVSTCKNVFKDAQSTFEYILANDKFGANELIIYGQSYGGYLAANIASDYQGEIKAMIIEGAFTSHKREAKTMSPLWGNLVSHGPKTEKAIKNFRKPLLVIHSTEDEMVPNKFGKSLFQAANAPKEYYEIDGRHIGGLHIYKEEIIKKIKAF